jgi:hypothetical protein
MTFCPIIAPESGVSAEGMKDLSALLESSAAGGAEIATGRKRATPQL